MCERGGKRMRGERVEHREGAEKESGEDLFLHPTRTLDTCGRRGSASLLVLLLATDLSPSRERDTLRKTKDRTNLGQLDQTETVGPTKWSFHSLSPTLVQSSSAIWSWTELKNLFWGFGGGGGGRRRREKRADKKLSLAISNEEGL